MRSHARRAACTALLVLLAVAASCSDAETERRAREAAEQVRSSIPDVQARALEQKVTAEDVRLAQAALTAAKEYQGEINGELDRVTINAIQAFQRAHGRRDDGILDPETLNLLRRPRN